MNRQQTLMKPAVLEGTGLHTGKYAEVRMLPAPPDSGIVFARMDLAGHPRVHADTDFVVETERCTVLEDDTARVYTTEHIMAAIAGMGIDNLVIELTGPEVPIMDGSALPFAQAMAEAGFRLQEAEPMAVDIMDEVAFRQGRSEITAKPGDGLTLSAEIHYDNPHVGRQSAAYTITPKVFLTEIAPARTFCFRHEVEMLREMGLIKGGSLDNALVVGEDGIMNGPLRFENEFARHKLLDLLGDLALLGGPVRGEISASRGGHTAHIGFNRRFRQTQDSTALV